jgi:hypothetical protein
MPLKKLLFKPGVNKENTSYANENGWFYSQWVRFRQGTPEKIGGYAKISYNTFLGTCRSLWAWATLGAVKLVGVGTNLKFYIQNSGFYYDVTPLQGTNTLSSSPIATTSGSSVITITDAGGLYETNGFVNLYPASAVGGITLFGNYQITTGAINTYTVNAVSPATISSSNPTTLVTQYKLANDVRVTLSTNGSLPSPLNTTTSYYTVNTSGFTAQLSLTSGGSPISTAGSAQYGQHTATALASSTATGGGTVYAAYEIDTGSAAATPQRGWGASTWGKGTWGVGGTSNTSIRLWQQSNFGEDLIIGYRGGAMYYWNATTGLVGTVCTISSANPAVLSGGVTLTNGMVVQFYTDGALPSPIVPGTTYYVINASGTTGNLSTTVGGGAISTAAQSQSGVHYISPRAYPLASLSGASNVPTIQNWVLVSDSSRFVFAFGANELGSATQNPMLIRWSDQGDPANWTPSATVQAGFAYLSHGSRIVAVMQARQEILVWTDSSLYSLQYVGTPTVWQVQLVGDNISIIGPNAVAYSNGVAYWMGVDKFYRYDGRTNTLNCDLRRWVFSGINTYQTDQVFASTSEGFNEVWWFYPASATSTQITNYVVYNYVENGGQGCWYYGTLGRTAWLDSGLLPYPLAATYSQNLVQHEDGLDNNEGATTVAIPASITSTQFDIDDGHNFGFVWRTLPDVFFEGSTSQNAQVTMNLYGMTNSGSGVNIPGSVGGKYSGAVQYGGYQTTPAGSSYPVQATYTGQIYTRVRGRQMIFEISSTMMGVNWQLGFPRIDIRPDGKR